MRLRLFAIAGLLCALPAEGDDTLLPQRVINVLTPIDSMPSMSALNDVFATPQLALDNLRSIALDPTVDLGIQLRAIRALPVYCPPAPQTCGTSTVVHDTLLALIDRYNAPHTPQDQLRLRAAIEALGAARSGLAADVDKLMPLLGNSSRDVRATVVRALSYICNMQAIAPLSTQLENEPTNQVRQAISTALKDLGHCS